MLIALGGENNLRLARGGSHVDLVHRPYIEGHDMVLAFDALFDHLALAPGGIAQQAERRESHEELLHATVIPHPVHIALDHPV